MVWNALWDTVCDPGLLWEMIEAYYDRVTANQKGEAKNPVIAQIDKARRLVKRAEQILQDPDSPVAYTDAKANLEKARRDLLALEARGGTAAVFVMPARKDVNAISAEFRRMRTELVAFEDRREALKTLVDKVMYADREAEIHCRLPRPKT